MQEEEKKEDPPLTDDRSHQNAQLNTSSTDEPISSTEKSIEAEQLQTTNYKSESEDMEVHHHAHDPAAPHHKKNWKSYFWEFFMLFLAVFCGFLAEYQLEHLIEKQRAATYAMNLYNDLKKDTETLNQVIIKNKIVAEKLDSFTLISKEGYSPKVNNGELYYFASYIIIAPIFENSNSSLDQLIGSGNLRLLQNELSQKISNYIELNKRLKADYLLSRTELVKGEELYFKIFDTQLEIRYSMTELQKMKDDLIKRNIPLLDGDKKKIRELAGWTHFISNTYMNSNNTYLIPLKEQNLQLMKLLDKEYHIKNE